MTQNGHDLNAEAILATSPDLVLWDKSNGPIEIVDQLRAAGVTVVVFDHERRMDKIIPQLKAVAQALGCSGGGRAGCCPRAEGPGLCSAGAQGRRPEG